MKNIWLKLGVGGSVFVGICCVTPLIPIVLGGVGLSGVVGYVYRDSVLFPILAIFLLIAGYGLWKQKQQ